MARRLRCVAMLSESEASDRTLNKLRRGYDQILHLRIQNGELVGVF
tara:strand:- start:760 stop:897 length:138 start_codon:yes stop_codon:yes gene_type:complete